MTAQHDARRPIASLPRPGQPVRMHRGSDVVAAQVVETRDGLLHLVAPDGTAPLQSLPGGPARLVWRGDHWATCVDGEVSPGRTHWTMFCDPASLATLDERARRRVAVRAPAHVSVPTRLSPAVCQTWTVNVSESGVALEPNRQLFVIEGNRLVVRLGFEDVALLMIGRVVVAEPAEPVRVAFERMSPAALDQLIGFVNRLEAMSRTHVR